MARARLRQKEVFVPLSHPPGHAQFDFGEATVVIAADEPTSYDNTSIDVKKIVGRERARWHWR